MAGREVGEIFAFVGYFTTVLHGAVPVFVVPGGAGAFAAA